jgi:hypothetical protein
VGGRRTRGSCKPPLYSTADQGDSHMKPINLWDEKHVTRKAYCRCKTQAKTKVRRSGTSTRLPLNNTSNQQARPWTLVPTEAMNFKGITISYKSSSCRRKVEKFWWVEPRNVKAVTSSWRKEQESLIRKEWRSKSFGSKTCFRCTALSNAP